MYKEEQPKEDKKVEEETQQTENTTRRGKAIGAELTFINQNEEVEPHLNQIY